MELTEIEKQKYYASWIKKIAKRHSLLGIKRHIVKHAKEIYDGEKEWVWCASMANLLAIYAEKTGTKVILDQKIGRLVAHYKESPKSSTLPPKGFNRKEWKKFCELDIYK